MIFVLVRRLRGLLHQMCVFVEILIQKATFLHKNVYLVDKHTYRTTVLHKTSCFVEKLGQRSSPNKKKMEIIPSFLSLNAVFYMKNP